MAKQMKWTFSWCFAQKCHGPAQVHSSWILFQSKLEETHWIKLCKSALLSISDLKQGFSLRMAQSYGGAVAHSIAVGSRAHHSKVSKSVEDFATLGSGQTDLDRGSCSFTASFQSLKEYSFEQINPHVVVHFLFRIIKHHRRYSCNLPIRCILNVNVEQIEQTYLIDLDTCNQCVCVCVCVCWLKLMEPVHPFDRKALWCCWERTTV